MVRKRAAMHQVWVHPLFGKKRGKALKRQNFDLIGKSSIF